MSDFFKKYSEIRGENHVQTLQLEGRIAVQIKTIRKSLNLSQQGLADLAGVPKSTIGRIEAGLTSPRVETLLQLSRALDTPFIIDGTNNSDNHNLYIQV
ncbi:helix-turn-helix domain-containing protein [Virgibacillus dakarensis]|uniref:helix-turn-helix domain-containing protein n=1 Tax=Virgibacillus dakarensis TaxID=1917889 RepID=UPI000B42E5E0|nr:helix-turn-helix transcriptional regulator [Virgibacillus dakarensis]MBT2218643.1 helix-turn-helix transcriptional regulator [Virgibacillus dakarensis]MTW85995.1 helix-turn-helix domain-containing protein [Virgibacillus dakarensis]